MKTTARDIMSPRFHTLTPQTPVGEAVRRCGADDLLEDAIRKMIFTDIHRLFVRETGTGDLVGVFSLSDAARIRSGSCHACVSSRITVDS
mgnify:CR=1 FL=1